MTEQTKTRDLSMPGTALDLAPMPRLRPGRCNYCGAAFKPRHPDAVTCSPDCKKRWDSLCISLGRALATRALTLEHAKRVSPTERVTNPETGKTRTLILKGKRAFSEQDRLARNAYNRLRQVWERQP